MKAARIMKIYKIAQTRYNDIYDIFEQVSEQESAILDEYFHGKRGTGKMMKWEVFPFARLKKIWDDRIRMGFIRDEAGLDMIIDSMLTNLARLTASTHLSGHSRENPDAIAAEHNYPPLGDDFYDNFLYTRYGLPLTDFGLDPLFRLADELLKTDDYDTKMSLVALMLQVTHMNGDLAAFFVEGGSDSLDSLKIGGLNQDNSLEDDVNGEVNELV